MIGLKKFFHWLMPYTCLLCRRPAQRAQDLCQACLDSLPFYPVGCKQCARTISGSQQPVTCGSCQKNPPPFAETIVLFNYQTPIVKLILDLKFQRALMNARVLGELLAEKILLRAEMRPEIIIPMPLHAKRLRERGFNQALEIAKPLSKLLNIPILRQQYQRIKPTLAQATLSAELREENMRGAFWVSENFSYQHVVVIDDVITTGNTITEFCLTLKNRGVKKIEVWCCARPALIKAAPSSSDKYPTPIPY